MQRDLVKKNIPIFLKFARQIAEGMQYLVSGHLCYRFPDSLVSFPDYLVLFPDYLVSFPDSLVSFPDSLVSFPDSLVSFPDSHVSFPDSLVLLLKLSLVYSSGRDEGGAS